jgi:hypothetical protein
MNSKQQPSAGRRSRVSPRTTAALLLAALSLTACPAAGPTPIRAIIDDPRRYDGQYVTIAGEVQDATNLVVLKWYRVADETGSIVVVASGAVPRRGARVEVGGTVRQAFAIGDESLTVVMEEAR